MIMIKPKCDKCRDELTEFGGLMFSPPQHGYESYKHREVEKFHVCVKCWKLLMEWIGFEEA